MSSCARKKEDGGRFSVLASFSPVFLTPGQLFRPAVNTARIHALSPPGGWTAAGHSRIREKFVAG